MGLADTAKLVASLDMKGNFVQQAGVAEGALGGLERKTSTLSKIGATASQGVGSAVRNIKLIGLAAAGAIGYAVKQGLESIASIQKEQAQTVAVLKSTGGIAGQTIDDITARSEKWSAAIGQNEEDVQHLQNVLLTFTNIGPKVFDDATTAALNMSQVLGQDLQSSAVQLGKALNDPITGMTALRRVGVSFTKEQIEQVKAMVAAGKTLDAQRLILRELNTEFGGSAEAFGQTAAGQFAIFKQNVQAAERQLATAFLPLLLKLGQQANAILGDKGVQEGIKRFGEGLAGGISDFVDILKGLPWGSIGDAFKIMGTGARIALDAFKSAPPWLQTAIVTGWGLDKLTGGAIHKITFDLVGSLAGQLTKGFFGRGSPANPMFVVAEGGLGGGTGGGIAEAAAKGGGILAGVKTLLTTNLAGGLLKGIPILRALPTLGGIGAVGAGVVIGKEIAQAINAPVINPAKGFEENTFKQAIQTTDLGKLHADLDAINAQLNTSDVGSQLALITSRIPYIGDALGNVAPALEKQRDELVAAITAESQNQRDQNAQEFNRNAAQRAVETNAFNVQQKLGSESLTHLNALRGIEDSAASTARTLGGQTLHEMNAINDYSQATAVNTGAISRKNFAPTVHITANLTSVVSLYELSGQQVHVQRTTVGGGFSET